MGLVQAATDRTLPPPPSISLLLPDEQTSVAQGQNVNISANIASSQNIPMARLECLIDGVSIGELLGPPYLWNWKPEQSGAHLLQIQGWDVYGQYGVSRRGAPHRHPSPARPVHRPGVRFHTDETTASNAARTAGMTEAPDALYTRLLTRDGHEVYRIATTSTPDKALLESYDLVIVSRSVALRLRLRCPRDDVARPRDSRDDSGGLCHAKQSTRLHTGHHHDRRG